MSSLLVTYLLLSFSTLLQIEYVIAFNLIKRATDRGFDLNELPPKSPSPNRSQQPDTQSPTQTSLQKKERKRKADRMYAAKWTFKALQKSKATLGEEEYTKLIEKSERRREMGRVRQHGYTKARRERKAAGKQTEKDKIHFEKKRKNSKKLYYEMKAEEYFDQKQNALKNANLAALSQIDNLFKIQQSNKKQKSHNPSAAKDT